jgi:hypothetical protein
MSALLNDISYFDNRETMLDESQRILLVGQLCSIYVIIWWHLF